MNLTRLLNLIKMDIWRIPTNGYKHILQALELLSLNCVGINREARLHRAQFLQ